jgi:WD domain, G-beta repeat
LATACACGYLPQRKTDTSVRLWDLAGRQEYRRLEGCEGGFYALAFSANGKTLAAAGNDRSVRLWEVATGKERCRFLGHQGWVASVAFSADGKALVSCSADTTVIVWAVMRGIGGGKDDRLSPEDLQCLWSDLAADDTGRAYQAMCRIVDAGPQGILLLKERLQPDRATDPQRLAQLLGDLDKESFDVREKATRELEQLGDLAGPALKKILEGKPTPEVRRRVERLLAQLEKGAPLTANRLRALRGIEVLEQIGSLQARQVLEALGQGERGSLVTTEAQLALRRAVSTSSP